MARSLARTTHLAIGLLGTSRPFTAVHRSLYRRLDGRGLLRRGLGVDAILLTTTGRRSGRQRTVPLFAIPLDTMSEGPGAASTPARWMVVASYAGRQRTPAWYRNIEAEPAVEVQLGDRRWRARARVAAGSEHERLWALAVAGYAGYDVYQDRIDRPIPIVILEPD